MVVLEPQGLQQVASAIVELNAAKLKRIQIDPSDLLCISRILVARILLDYVADPIATWFCTQIFVVVLVEFERGEVLECKLTAYERTGLVCR